MIKNLLSEVINTNNTPDNSDNFCSKKQGEINDEDYGNSKIINDLLVKSSEDDILFDLNPKIVSMNFILKLFINAL